jgi:hypothetical protein
LLCGCDKGHGFLKTPLADSNPRPKQRLPEPRPGDRLAAERLGHESIDHRRLGRDSIHHHRRIVVPPSPEQASSHRRAGCARPLRVA